AGGRLDCSTSAIRGEIKSGRWSSFDDAYLLGLIRSLVADDDTSDTTRCMADAILRRRPPKLLAQLEYLEKRSRGAASDFRNRRKRVDGLLDAWAKSIGIPLDMWHVREGSLTMTKIGANIPISELALLDEDETHQAIRVLKVSDNSSAPIMSDRRSLMF